MSKVRIYASGSGALSFVRVDGRNIACAPHKISMQEATQAIIDSGNPYENFELVEYYGEPFLIPAITYDEETDTVVYDGNRFKIIRNHWYMMKSDGEVWRLVINVNIAAALKFYENNPKLYKKGE